MKNDHEFNDLLHAFNLEKEIDDDDSFDFDEDEDDDDDDLFDLDEDDYESDSMVSNAMIDMMMEMFAQRVADETSDRIASLLGLDDTADAYELPERWYMHALDFIEDKGLLKEFRRYCEEAEDE